LAESAAFLPASVSVQCAVIPPVPTRRSSVLSSTYTGVTAPLQMSLALAPAFQVASAVVLPVPSHSTLSLAGGVRLGSVVSTIVRAEVPTSALLSRREVVCRLALDTHDAPQPG